jgi:hypothetical protein
MEGVHKEVAKLRALLQKLLAGNKVEIIKESTTEIFWLKTERHMSKQGLAYLNDRFTSNHVCSTPNCQCSTIMV